MPQDILGAESLCSSKKQFEEFMNLKFEDDGSGNCRRICWLPGECSGASYLIANFGPYISALGVCDTDSDLDVVCLPL